MATTVFQLSDASGATRVDWLHVDTGTSGGTDGKIALINAAGTSGSPDTSTYPASSFPVGSLYIVTDSTPPNATYRTDGTNWTLLDATPDVACTLSNSSTQSISNSTTTQVTFDTEDTDTDGMGDVANNRIVIQSPGRYLIGALVKWASNSTGERLSNIEVNAASVAQDRRAASTTSHASLTSAPTSLAASDAVTLEVSQSSGGALNLAASCQLWVVRVG